MTGPSNKNKNKKTAAAAGFPMAGVDVEQLERLLDFMAVHGLEEFEYEHGGLHIRLRKAASGMAVSPRSAAKPDAGTISDSPSTHPQSSPVSESGGATHPASPAATAEELHIIKSPIVGTFYSASSPDSPPFVAPGDSIQEGKVVCIVEAMKLMNEIEADVSGEVVRILAENGQPVEYGQGLFAIRTAKSKKK
jgi:acetyl-CoA carboxylase biotin carboxyl carrier protein